MLKKGLLPDHLLLTTYIQDYYIYIVGLASVKPDLEIDRQTPLGEEQVETGVGPQFPHAGLIRTERLKRTHKLHCGRVVLVQRGTGDTETHETAVSSWRLVRFYDNKQEREIYDGLSRRTRKNKLDLKRSTMTYTQTPELYTYTRQLKMTAGS